MAINLHLVNALIVRSISLVVSRSQWLAWEALMTEAQRGFDQQIASFYRGIPVVIDDSLPPTEIHIVDIKTGDPIGRIINLAIPIHVD